MKLDSREDMAGYAMEICIPLMERTAKRRLEGYRTEVNDSAGYLLTFVENFCRPLWGIAPVIKESKEIFYLNVEGESVELCHWIRQVVLEAVEEQSPYNWFMNAGQDPSSYYNQMKTELAGLLVGMFLAREKLWDPYTNEEKQKIADWVYEINHKAYQVVWDCNHIWFIMLNVTILRTFGFSYGETDSMIKEGLNRLDRMYVGNGFYQDGQFGRFDYYGPWAMHLYPFLWCMAAEGTDPDQESRKREYQRRTEAFLEYYTHMFDSNGCHIPFGRSLAYRFAACALFPLAVHGGCTMNPGLARRIVLENISYFKEHAALDHGIYPPGFLYKTSGAVENYTSDGGAYWCTKAFLALLMPEDHPFWTAPKEELPSEKGAFLCESGHPDIHMTLSGDSYGSVTLYNNTANYLQNQKKTQWFLDMAGCYSKFAYNSRTGFGISTRDSVSCDNMISLVTPDGTMESHRMGFEDLGEHEGMLKSRHIPFSNDPETSVTTCLWILPNGGDVRIHQVILAQPYSIREGGFPVPMDHDRRKIEKTDHMVSVEAGDTRSAMKVWGSIPLRTGIRDTQPGMNLMKPMACYPMYETDLLEKGTYLFVSVNHLTFELDKNDEEGTRI